jgi:hypothetical protein
MTSCNSVIRDVQQVIDLWTRTYNEARKPDWSHLLPYYAEAIHFVDSVQELHGITAFRSSVVHGASRLTLDEQGKIAAQRDYYDLWGDIFDNIPGFNTLYRKFMRKVFG